MIKLLLERIVGCDTVSVRSFNIAQSLIILATAIMVASGINTSLPSSLVHLGDLLITGSILSVIFGVASFASSKVMRSRICGAISLLFGIILNTIISAGAFLNFPPFDTLIVSSPLLAIWYFIAFLFIFEVEGYNASADRSPG